MELPKKYTLEGDPVWKEIDYLISSYPYKKEIWAHQKVSPEQVSNFHQQQIRKIVSGNSDFYQWMDGDTLKGFFILQKSEWPSTMLKRNVVRVDYPLYWNEVSLEEWAQILSEIPKLSAKFNPEILDIKIDSSDLNSFWGLSRNGWYWLGLSIILGLDTKVLDNHYIEKYTVREGSVIKIRDCLNDDLPHIKAIAHKSHERNHYLNNPAIPEDIKNDIFPKWLEKCFNGLASKIMVAEHEGEIAGFITLMHNRSFSKIVGREFGIVDFVAVSPEFQGEGIGGKLMIAGMNYLNETSSYIMLRTMHDNYGAIKFYQKLGFTIIGGDHHFQYEC